MIGEYANPTVFSFLDISRLNKNILLVLDDEVSLYECVILVVERGALFLNQRFDRNRECASNLIETGDYVWSDGKQGHTDDGASKPIIEFS